MVHGCSWVGLVGEEAMDGRAGVTECDCAEVVTEITEVNTRANGFVSD